MESNTTSLPEGTRIGRTALRVSNLATTTAFYETVVGLEVLRQSDSRTVLGAGETELLVLQRDETLSNRPVSAAGLYHTAFRVPSRAALGDALRRVQAHSRLDGASDHLVSEALYLSDPEGNGVELYRDRPRADWPLDENGRVRIGTEPLDTEQLERAGSGNSQAPAGTDIGHVHLEVTALDRFEHCYVDTLGFEVQTRTAGAVFVSAGGYHHHIGANVWQNRTDAASGRGLSWVELLLPETAHVEALRDHLADSQYTTSVTDTSLVLTDSDGIEFRIRAN